MQNTGKDPLRGKFTRFLQSTIKNVVTDYLWKTEKRQSYPDWFRMAPSQEEYLGRSFNFHWDALAEAYQSLPRAYQEVLFLLLVKEMTPQETAEYLHCSVQQVYCRKSRALKRLRNQLGGKR